MLLSAGLDGLRCSIGLSDLNIVGEEYRPCAEAGLALALGLEPPL